MGITIKEVLFLKRQVSVFIGAFQRRRHFSALLCGIVAVALVLGAVPLESHAASAEKNYKGFTYEIRAGKVYITDYPACSNRADSEDVVTVPGKIENKPVVSVDLYDMGGKLLSLKQCTKLKDFYGLGLFFEKIDFSNANDLRTLSIWESGKATSLNLNSCKKLIDLTLSIETLKKLDVNSCVKLKELKVFHGKVEALNLSKLPALQSIVIERTGLASINLGKNRSLKELDVRYNKLKKLDISGCPSLEVLDFSYNSKLSANISNNKKLKKLIYSPRTANGECRTVTNPRKASPRIVQYTNM
jgi:hypothetical protein